MFFVSINCNTTGVTSGAEIAYTSGVPRFLLGIRVTQSLVFIVVLLVLLALSLF